MRILFVVALWFGAGLLITGFVADGFANRHPKGSRVELAALVQAGNAP